MESTELGNAAFWRIPEEGSSEPASLLPSWQSAPSPEHVEENLSNAAVGNCCPGGVHDPGRDVGHKRLLHHEKF